MKHSANWPALFFTMFVASVLVVFLCIEIKEPKGVYHGFMAAIFTSFMFMRTALIYFKVK